MGTAARLFAIFRSLPRVFCNVRCALSIRDMLVSCSVCGFFRESRWYRG